MPDYSEVYKELEEKWDDCISWKVGTFDNYRGAKASCFHDLRDEHRKAKKILKSFFRVKLEIAFKEGYDKAFATIPNPSYSQAEVDRQRKEEREKVFEELKLWRPYFYRDKITDEDIENLTNSLRK